MRITRETLIKIARDTVLKRTRRSTGIVTAYLCGSLLEEEYLLGGTTDIDLVFVHMHPDPPPREIVRMTDEVHLDISHHSQKEYEQPRAIRLDPWMGPTVFACQPLHDVGHFMDFTQASVRGQFDRADYKLERARPLAEHARQIWFALQETPPEPDLPEIIQYLQAIQYAANAVALLSSPPLTERRFLLKFAHCAEAVGRPGLQAGLLGLLGGANVDADQLRTWIPAWAQAFSALPADKAPARLHSERKYYYLRAFEAMLEMEEPRSLLWPLLNTWTDAASLFPPESTYKKNWRIILQNLGILGEGFPEKVAALDAYLDMVEETLDSWADQSGA